MAMPIRRSAISLCLTLICCWLRLHADDLKAQSDVCALTPDDDDIELEEGAGEGHCPPSAACMHEMEIEGRAMESPFLMQECL
jgi:hypothetical protein